MFIFVNFFHKLKATLSPAMDYHKYTPSRVANQNVGFVIDNTEAGGYKILNTPLCI